MKYFQRIILISLISAIGFSSLQAQEIDQERMQRDINIMENILEEMFKTTWENRGNNIQVFRIGNDQHVKGIFMEDYGVLFTVSGGAPSIITFLNSNSGGAKALSENSNEEVKKEDIIKRITEFLGDYGSTISQLKSDDKVTVIFNADINRYAPAFTLLSDPRGNINVDPNTKLLPTIRVTAKISVLQAYRKGRINEIEFKNRLSISEIKDSSDKHRDLKIMANILKTTFEEADNDEFTVRGSVNHLYLDDLGAFLYVNASYGSGLFGLGRMAISVRKKLANIAGADSIFYKNNLDPDSKNMSEAELQEQAKQSYMNFMQQLKETIIDYGRTLQTVQSGEKVIVSVSVPDTGAELPKKVDLQIQKSVLEAVGKSDISREQAMEQISVREH